MRYFLLSGKSRSYYRYLDFGNTAQVSISLGNIDTLGMIYDFQWPAAIITAIATQL
jgi:hypothetical protein